MAIKLFCDVCGVELAPGENRVSAGWTYVVPVTPDNGPPKNVTMQVGIGIGEAVGQGEICRACSAKAGHGALQQHLAGTV